jgi:hypothetical protein
MKNLAFPEEMLKVRCVTCAKRREFYVESCVVKLCILVSVHKLVVLIPMIYVIYSVSRNIHIGARTGDELYVISEYPSVCPAG